MAPKDETSTVEKEKLLALLSCLDPSKPPDELPGRKKELDNIQTFIVDNLKAHSNGCLYMSGVPGIGKTASVRRVVQDLMNKKTSRLPEFVFIELNGMIVSDPKRIFVEFYKELLNSGKFFDVPKKSKKILRISPTMAMKKLEQLFELEDESRPAVVLLLDEIDGLVTKRQQHLYQLLDWSTQDGAKLTIVAIANTLDLPERILSNRNQSRLGQRHLCFQPYNHKQIEDILISRLGLHVDAVERDATQLVARKVASISSDVRRAFEVFRFTIEMVISEAEQTGLSDKSPGPKKRKRTEQCQRIGMRHVMEALNKISTNVKVQAVKIASAQEKLFLKAAVEQVRRTGKEGISFSNIWDRYCDICQENEDEHLSVDELLDVANRLAECRLLTKLTSSNADWQDFTARYRLNINPGEVDLALAEKTR